MLGVIFLALAAAAPASPAPLKTIVHEHSSPFCTALHQDVAPAVLRLIRNKRIVTDGKALFLQFADDRVRHSVAIDLHMVQLNDLIGPMAQNLIQANDALNRLPPAVGSPSSDGERLLVQLRAELSRVADEQRNMLNVFSGTYGSFTSNGLLGRENPLGNAVRDTLPAPAAGPRQNAEPPVALALKTPMQTGAKTATPQPAPAATPGFIDIGLAGTTVFAQMYNQLTRYQIDELHVESQASQSILQSASLCR